MIIKNKSIFGIIFILLVIPLVASACNSSGLGTALGVKEEFTTNDQGGVYKLTGKGFSAQYRIGDPPEELADLRPVKVDVTATVGREPGKLHMEFDAPEGQAPLILDLAGGETRSGSGVGLVSDERVMIDFNAFKVGAGDVEIIVEFEYQE